MDSRFQSNTVYHGSTVVLEENPPPYSGPGTSAYYTAQPTPLHIQQAVVVNPGVIVSLPLGPNPTQTTCKSCGTLIVTRVETQSTVRTHLCAALICLLFWPLVCLPYCMDSCKSSHHYCPSCNAYIGRH